MAKKQGASGKRYEEDKDKIRITYSDNSTRTVWKRDKSYAVTKKAMNEDTSSYQKTGKAGSSATTASTAIKDMKTGKSVRGGAGVINEGKNAQTITQRADKAKELKKAKDSSAHAKEINKKVQQENVKQANNAALGVKRTLATAKDNFLPKASMLLTSAQDQANKYMQWQANEMAKQTGQKAFTDQAKALQAKSAEKGYRKKQEEQYTQIKENIDKNAQKYGTDEELGWGGKAASTITGGALGMAPATASFIATKNPLVFRGVTAGTGAAGYQFEAMDEMKAKKEQDAFNRYLNIVDQSQYEDMSEAQKKKAIMDGFEEFKKQNPQLLELTDEEMSQAQKFADVGGAVAAVTDMLFRGAGLVTKKSLPFTEKGMEALSKAVTSKAGAGAGKAAKEVGEHLGEGAEEILENFIMDPMARATYNPQHENTSLKENLIEGGTAALISGLIGGGRYLGSNIMNTAKQDMQMAEEKRMKEFLEAGRRAQEKPEAERTPQERQIVNEVKNQENASKVQSAVQKAKDVNTTYANVYSKMDVNALQNEVSELLQAKDAGMIGENEFNIRMNMAQAAITGRVQTERAQAEAKIAEEQARIEQEKLETAKKEAEQARKQAEEQEKQAIVAENAEVAPRAVENIQTTEQSMPQEIASQNQSSEAEILPTAKEKSKKGKNSKKGKKTTELDPNSREYLLAEMAEQQAQAEQMAREANEEKMRRMKEESEKTERTSEVPFVPPMSDEAYAELEAKIDAAAERGDAAEFEKLVAQVPSNRMPQEVMRTKEMLVNEDEDPFLWDSEDTGGSYNYKAPELWDFDPYFKFEGTNDHNRYMDLLNEYNDIGKTITMLNMSNFPQNHRERIELEERHDELAREMTELQDKFKRYYEEDEYPDSIEEEQDVETVDGEPAEIELLKKTVRVEYTERGRAISKEMSSIEDDIEKLKKLSKNADDAEKAEIKGKIAEKNSRLKELDRELRNESSLVNGLGEVVERPRYKPFADDSNTIPTATEEVRPELPKAKSEQPKIELDDSKVDGDTMTDEQALEIENNKNTAITREKRKLKAAKDKVEKLERNVAHMDKFGWDDMVYRGKYHDRAWFEAEIAKANSEIDKATAKIEGLEKGDITPAKKRAPKEGSQPRMEQTLKNAISYAKRLQGKYEDHPGNGQIDHEAVSGIARRYYLRADEVDRLVDSLNTWIRKRLADENDFWARRYDLQEIDKKRALDESGFSDYYADKYGQETEEIEERQESNGDAPYTKDEFEEIVGNLIDDIDFRHPLDFIGKINKLSEDPRMDGYEDELGSAMERGLKEAEKNAVETINVLEASVEEIMKGYPEGTNPFDTNIEDVIYLEDALDKYEELARLARDNFLADIPRLEYNPLYRQYVYRDSFDGEEQDVYATEEDDPEFNEYEDEYDEDYEEGGIGDEADEDYLKIELPEGETAVSELVTNTLGNNTDEISEDMVQDIIESGAGDYYIRRNAETFKRAQERLQNIEKEERDLLSGALTNAEDVETAYQIIRIRAQEGNMRAVKRMAEVLSEEISRNAQNLQILSTHSKHSTAGIVMTHEAVMRGYENKLKGKRKNSDSENGVPPSKKGTQPSKKWRKVEKETEEVTTAINEAENTANEAAREEVEKIIKEKGLTKETVKENINKAKESKADSEENRVADLAAATLNTAVDMTDPTLEPKRMPKDNAIVNEILQSLQENGMPDFRDSRRRPSSKIDTLKYIFDNQETMNDVFNVSYKFLRERYKSEPEKLKLVREFFEDKDSKKEYSQRTMRDAIFEMAKVSEIDMKDLALQGNMEIERAARQVTEALANRVGFRDISDEGDDADKRKRFVKETLGEFKKIIGEYEEENLKRRFSPEKDAIDEEEILVPNRNALTSEIMQTLQENGIDGFRKNSKKPFGKIESLRYAYEHQDEMKSTFDKSRKLMSEKYDNDPEAMATVEAFFEKGIIPSISNKTIEGAIGEAADITNIDLKNLIYKSSGDKKAAIREIVPQIVDGMGITDINEANEMANRIIEVYNKTLNDAANKKLNQMFKRPKVLNKKGDSEFEKIQHLINLGAYERQDIVDIIKEKNGIPVLNETDIANIDHFVNEANKYEIGSRKYNENMYRAMEVARNKFPKTLQDITTNGKRIVMLANLRTLVKNFAANIPYGAEETLNSPVAGAIDAATSKVLGTPRTRTVTPHVGAGIKGFANGVKEFGLDVLSRTDTYRMGDDAVTQYEMPRAKTFGNNNAGIFMPIDKFLGLGEDWVSYGLRSGDQPFYESHKERMMANLKDLGYDTSNPYVQEIAANYARSVVFQDETKLSDSALKLRDGLNDMGEGLFGSWFPFRLGDFVIAFAQTPANIADKMIDMHPVIGTTRALLDDGGLLRKDTAFDQRKFVDRMARVFSGSAIMGISYGLAAAGVITGSAPEDNDERNAKYLAGWRPMSFHIGDKYYDYSFFLPISAFMTIGADAYYEGYGTEVLDMIVDDLAMMKDADLSPQERAEILGDAAKRLPTFIQETAPATLNIKSGVNCILNNSFLKSVEELFGGYGDSTADNILNAAQDFPGQYASGPINALGNITDEYQRETYDPNPLVQTKNKVQSKVPFLREGLPVKKDVYGNDQMTNQGRDMKSRILENTVIPSTISEKKADKVNDEMIRLFESTGDNSHFFSKPEKKIDFGGDKVALTAVQWNDFIEKSNGSAYKMVSEVMDLNAYKDMSDEEKIAVVKEITSYCKADAKYKLGKELGKSAKEPGENPLEKYREYDRIGMTNAMIDTVKEIRSKDSGNGVTKRTMAEFKKTGNYTKEQLEYIEELVKDKGNSWTK